MHPVRFSHLKAYGRSAMHGYHARTMESDPTYAMQRGTAVHAMILGNRQVVAYPGAVRRGREYDAFVAEHADAEILTRAEYDKACLMADAVRASKVAAPYLRGTVETTIRFRWNGLDCRATPDVRGADFLTEIKTAKSSDPAKFQWSSMSFGYHAQMRFQQIACGASVEQMECFVICIESSPPFPVTVFRMDEEALEIGERSLVLWSERLKTCEQSGSFPPYVECVVPLTVPSNEDDLIYPDEPIEEPA